MGFLEDHKTLAIATVAATGGALALWTITAHRRRQLSSPATTTDFDSFLSSPIDNPSLQKDDHSKQKKKNYAATSFEAYLTNNESPSSSSSQPFQTGDNTVAATAPCCPPDYKPVTIFYGTEFGFSREIAGKLYHSIENCNSKIWSEVLNLADFPDGVPCLDQCQVVLIACSTQGDGVPPTEVRDFCSWLFGPTAPKLSSLEDSLSSPSSSTARTPAGASTAVKFSVLALGDRSYTHFARCGKTIDARLEELGGQRFLPRVDVNKEDMKVVDTWIDDVIAQLEILNLKTAEDLGWNGVLASLSNTLDNTNNTTTATNGIAVNNTPKWSKSKPYFAVVTKIESLCTSTTQPLLLHSSTTNTPADTNTNSTNSTHTNIIMNDKNTVSVVLDLGDSGIEYLPGDALGIWPKNDIHDVNDLLDAAGFQQKHQRNTVIDSSRSKMSDGTGSEEEAMVNVPPWHYKDQELEFNNDNSGLISLEDALTRCYDLKTPKPDLVKLLAEKLAIYLKKEEEESGSLPAETSGIGNGLTNGTPAANGTSHTGESNNSETLLQCDNGNVNQQLSSLLALTNTHEKLEKYLSQRHVADILRDWKPAKLTVEELLSVLRQLQPRLYSISSSPLENTLNTAQQEVVMATNDDDGEILPRQQKQYKNTVQLTVAVVHYTSAVGKSRVGVASTYLAERSQGLLLSTNALNHLQAPLSLPSPEHDKEEKSYSRQTRVPVYLYKNPDFRLPADLKTPIIMVGPGTGVAPFRGFIQHRILLAAAKEKERKERNRGLQSHDTLTVLGPALLFFGCRRRDQDFLYSTELESWAAKGHIQLFTAFSRETDKKIYVQHRLVEQGERVWRLLEARAVFYVCGDGAHMASDVERALKSIIEKYQGQGSAAAVEYFENMVKTGHYKKDVWVS